jgi:negative regulator of sigma E activity
MVLTLLKFVAGLAVLGVVAMVLIAVISGLVASVRALRREKDPRDRP